MKYATSSTLVIVLVVLGVTSPPRGRAAIVYANDFEGSIGSEWSQTIADVTPAGSRRFLGQFGNDAVTLSLTGLPTHSDLTLEFDLFVIRTWGGNGVEQNSVGPDVWRLEIIGAQTLLNTTFGHSIFTQAYPGTFPGGSFPSNTGASEVNSLGFPHPVLGTPNDAVYHLSFTVPHLAPAVTFRFTGIGLEPLNNESWGVDNVRVSTVPEPSSAALLVSGIAFCIRRRSLRTNERNG